MLRSMCQHVARSQFDYCAKKHSLCRTVMLHDELNMFGSMPWCSFPCHKLLADAKRGVVQSKFDP